MDARALETTCCIAGGGPAGLMLGLLLARAGVDVVVLEKHDDFLRDFRGDTIHPSTIDLLDELGLQEAFLRLPHTRVETLDVVVAGNRITPIDFRTLRGGTRFLALMPQWDFLDFIAREAARLPHFRLIKGAKVTGLRRKWGRVVGVTARGSEGEFTVRAHLTVAADGRGSVVRRSAGLPVAEFGVAVDVLWFHLPTVGEVRHTLAYMDGRSVVLTIPRDGYFQAGMIIPKGAFTSMQEEGLAAFQRRLAETASVLAPVVGSLESWSQVKLLTVQVNRLRRWYAPGLLCIGDAAHAMSPAFGVGVNYAIQDAVATANLLAAGLRGGTVTTRELLAVQRRRLPAVRIMQPLQLQLHRRIAKPGSGFRLPHPLPPGPALALRLVLPLARGLTARLVGRGIRPEHISPELRRLFESVGG
ncbi:FAD-dependent oxidoreductase [Salinibacterium sp. SYSU T00001]|uniref:FAD-dependent oxidoreductase n=1 Tax=Homoserinimonas sedimenticola TaxID=2986805 RepID=UPI0022354C94|nr:FAD-dependent oxidoreductase [Salinibacterium sedimenticola]MCW4386573.1 FAD-dependent oxidoreductase [Salinibacterium sedimenticola]